ncbi:phosphatase and actin regulator 2 isoform X2 [Latimeria chalumnae]|uniref:phosphatase and actin regulator 2 isoform X2 n=1 Tax=Latimeria chalumnae TaxID=7897 RepID=UPI00313E6B06
MGQTSASALSQQANSVDGLEKTTVTDSDGQTSGSQTPPLKRKGKLSSLGKIFKPWKWRKKKTSEKFRETSAVLERKISTRQSRDELIKRGLLKEVPEQDGDINAKPETSNGHTISISVEPVTEENPADLGTENGSMPAKATVLEEKTEDKKASTENHPLPEVQVPPAQEPKPKKKALLPPKASAAATSHKGRDAMVKKNKTASKQPPAPPPKPANRKVTQVAAANSSQPRKTSSSKPSSQSPASSSSHLKNIKDPSSKKTGTSGTPKTLKGPEKWLELPATSPVPPEPSEETASAPTISSEAQPGTEAEEPTKSEHSCSQAQREKDPVQQPLSSALQNNSSSVICSDISPSCQGVPSNTSLSSQQASADLNLSSLTEQEKAKDGAHPDINQNVSGEKLKCSTSEEEEDEQKVASGPGVRVLIGDSPDVSIIPDDENKDSLPTDSDSDGPVLYKDDEEEADDDDDDYTSSSLASKVRRRDTLAIKLGNRPTKKELEDKNILQCTSEEERHELLRQIGTKLVRCCPCDPMQVNIHPCIPKLN